MMKISRAIQNFRDISLKIDRNIDHQTEIGQNIGYETKKII
jgi:hypothetical protein